MTSSAHPSRWRNGLDVFAILLSCVAAGTILLNYWRQPNESFEFAGRTVFLDRNDMLGSPSASVALIEYVDFECPSCARFARETLPLIQRRYIDTGRVVLAVRHFPLIQLHPEAARLAEAAVCAGLHGRFEVTYAELFSLKRSHRPQIIPFEVGDEAERAALETCIVSGVGRTAVTTHVKEAQSLGVRGTPTFFVGRLAKGVATIEDRLVGARPVGEFELALERVLKQVGTH